MSGSSQQSKIERILNIYGVGYSTSCQTGVNRSYYEQTDPGHVSEYLLISSKTGAMMVKTFTHVVQYGSIGEQFASDNEFFALDEYVVQVSCGLKHSLEGYESVYAAGHNKLNECGLPKSTTLYNIYGVRKLGDIEGKRLKYVAPGGFYTVFVTVDNCVYVSGCLGQGHESKSAIVPTKVDHTDLNGLKVIKSVECGKWHTIVIVQDGAAYAWGSNIHGQCGLNSTSDQRIGSRTLVSGIPEYEKVAELWSGSFCVTTKEGGVYVFGGRRSAPYLGNSQSKLEYEICLPWKLSQDTSHCELHTTCSKVGTTHSCTVFQRCIQSFLAGYSLLSERDFCAMSLLSPISPNMLRTLELLEAVAL